jgi:FMN phosphatase YigB (HAD superfamily)
MNGCQRKTVEHYQAWLVDFDGTLYSSAGVRLVMAMELSLGHWQAMAVLRRFRHEHENLRHASSVRAESPYRLQIERTAGQLNKPVAEIESLVGYWTQKRPAKWIKAFRRRRLLEEIRRFRQAGGRTALVSDYPARAKLEALGAHGLFDAVIASGEPGGPTRLKPCPDGYLLAAGRLGIEPSDCLVLGDRLDADGEAARRAGMAFRRIG